MFVCLRAVPYPASHVPNTIMHPLCETLYVLHRWRGGGKHLSAVCILHFAHVCSSGTSTPEHIHTNTLCYTKFNTRSSVCICVCETHASAGDTKEIKRICSGECSSRGSPSRKAQSHAHLCHMNIYIYIHVYVAKRCERYAPPRHAFYSYNMHEVHELANVSCCARASSATIRIVILPEHHVRIVHAFSVRVRTHVCALPGQQADEKRRTSCPIHSLGDASRFYALYMQTYIIHRDATKLRGLWVLGV